MKAGGVSAQKTTESGNQSKSEEKKREGDANNNNEENLRKWKTNLDAACQGEKLSPGSGGHLDGWRRLSGLDGGQCSIRCPLLSSFLGRWRRGEEIGRVRRRHREDNSDCTRQQGECTSYRHSQGDVTRPNRSDHK